MVPTRFANPSCPQSDKRALTRSGAKKNTGRTPGTEVYLRADPTEKLEALTAMTPPMLKPGRFRAPDKVLAMLSAVGRKPDYAE